ncbi:olfactory receptor 1E16-like [Gastrophryne carolinensis]
MEVPRTQRTVLDHRRVKFLCLDFCFKVPSGDGDSKAKYSLHNIMTNEWAADKEQIAEQLQFLQAEQLYNSEMVVNICRTNETIQREFYIVAFSATPETQPILFTGILIIYLIAMLENVMITLLIIKSPQLHTPMYTLLCNLSLLDMSLISVTIPELLAIIWKKVNTLSFNRCITQMYFFIATANIESFLLTSMSYDRYVAICNPLHYPLIMNRVSIVLLSLVSWFLGFLNSLLLSLLTYNLSFCKSNIINNFFCDLKALLKLSCSDISLIQTIIFVDNVVIGFFPCSLTLTSYIYIISSVLKVQSKEGRHKAFSNCTSHLTTIFLFYGTALCLYMVPNTENSPTDDGIFSFVYVALIPMANPLVYSLRNKDVLGAFLVVTGWNKKSKMTFKALT